MIHALTLLLIATIPPCAFTSSGQIGWMIQAFETYLHKLRETAKDEQTEHTGRAALQELLQVFAAKGRNIRVQHEPRQVQDKGAPDFRAIQNAMTLGYVEVKKIDADLAKVLKSDQIKKYLTLSGNIILTDYLHFILLGPKGVKQRASLAFSSDLEARQFRIKPENAAAVAEVLDLFFTETPEGIGTSDKLALALASRSKLLRDFLGEELVRQEKEHQEGRLWGLFGELKRQVFHELSLKEFSDAFAQMLAYGLFLAKLNSAEPQNEEERKRGIPVKREVTLANAKSFIPASFQLIRELVNFLDELDKPEYVDIKWVVVEILSIVNGLDLASIHENLSFRQRKATSRKVRAKDEEEHRLFERDPFIYFYEDYLKAFDKDTRKGRGVYYTPPPIVNFIVRAVDDILKDKFEIPDGLADHKRVTVLDFACGTGTFLLEVMNKIFENIGGPEKGIAASVVRDHILKNIYGFEYLIAPYTIAHLKLSQYLKDKGHPLAADERLQVFLTNTLEPIAPQPNFLLPSVTEEVKAAQDVKDKPILVIVGNPPYSGHSKNKGKWITASIAKYREGFPELSKPAQGKWLQDDYVKFIRFAQMKMEAVEQGVLAIISNHSWLDNPTFKGMRKSLSETFNQIFILDLHGNTKKKEIAPNGLSDKNVFDIEQGVSIAILVKRKSLPVTVQHGDIWGERIEKYSKLSVESLDSACAEAINPVFPDWLLKPQDVDKIRAYRQMESVAEIFSPMGDPAPGFATQHDDFAISFSKAEAQTKVTTFLAATSEGEAREIFDLCAQDQWQYKRATQELRQLDIETKTITVTYRPFDTRWTVWDRNVAVHRRLRVSEHLLKPNCALIVSKNAAAIGNNEFDGCSLSDRPVELNFFRRGGEFIFPIYLWTPEGDLSTENISPSIRTFLDARYAHHYEPEEILGYIYAILHAPSYRKRYAEFLRIDFPRIPFCETKAQFDALSKFGWELVQAHLLKKLSRKGLGDFHGKGDNGVEAIRYSPQERAIHINATQHFAPVPEDVWNFHIGGYQVLDKWLKSRKGRKLELDDLKHVGKVADSLAFTIEQMAKIDVAYLAAFPTRV